MWRWNRLGATGSCDTTCSSVDSGVAPLKGGRPVSISYKSAPQAVDIDGGRDLSVLPRRLFGGDVAGRAQDLAAGRQPAVTLEALGHPEVGDLRLPLRIERGHWPA